MESSWKKTSEKITTEEVQYSEDDEEIMKVPVTDKVDVVSVED